MTEEKNPQSSTEPSSAEQFDSQGAAESAAEVAEEITNETSEEATGEEVADAAPQASDDSEVDEKYAALEESLGQARDENIRLLAEMQNLRRRTERDVENAHKFGLEKLVKELLAVVDNLERAMEAAAATDQEQNKALIEGIELTYKSFLDSLKKFGVEQVDPHGEPFNPELHQAISMVPSPDAEPNSVLNVFQKGYTLSGRLVRPAMVVVAKAG